MTGPNSVPCACGGAAGFNLVILMVMVTVMNVAIALALPTWSHFAQREKEEETIFRGLQYAEGIRVFQQRHGRPPARLEELVEVKPRAMRQLYSNPMTENGAWGLLVTSVGQPQNVDNPQAGDQGRGVELGGARVPRRAEPAPRAAGATGDQRGTGGNARSGRVGFGQIQRLVAIPPRQDERSDRRGRGNFGRPRDTVSAPIMGVWPGIEGDSVKVFADNDSYSGWHFSVQLIPLPVILGDNPAPRVNAQWIGRPFEKGVQMPGGAIATPPPQNPGSPRDLAAPPSVGNRRRRG